ncbi:MAG: hypothetical protein K2I06_00950 [Ruminococcus sp.]|nr:hypothetical protein [Ruminococcus sp.]
MTEYRIYIAKNCFDLSDLILYKIVHTREEAVICCEEHNDSEAYSGKKEYYCYMKCEF